MPLSQRISWFMGIKMTQVCPLHSSTWCYPVRPGDNSGRHQLREQLRVRGAVMKNKTLEMGRCAEEGGPAGDMQEVVRAMCRELGRGGVMSANIQSRTACYHVQWRSLRS